MTVFIALKVNTAGKNIVWWTAILFATVRILEYHAIDQTYGWIDE